MKYSFRLFTLLLFVFGCTSKNNEHLNDLENIDGWFQHPQIKAGFAHSGEYYCYTDDINPYSITFRKKLLDFNEGKQIKQIIVNAWILFTNKDCKAALVASIDSSEHFIPVVYSSTDATKQITGIEQWTQIKTQVDIPEKIDLNNYISIYVKNNGNYPVLIDDISYSYY
ncbi:MAG: hypothetical protein IPJ93_15645 [Bacteroidota bacterium]|nr:MAG: hypothetical protein IPJ93_15645 [Bacteroidota bacterium]